jgi:hypothetical protein
MTTKPKTRKAPAAETGINPKLTALAAKLDKAHAHARVMEARQDPNGKGGDPDELATEKVYEKIWRLEEKLGRIDAKNLEEFKLKAHYANIDDIVDDVTYLIVLELRALDDKPPVARMGEEAA